MRTIIMYTDNTQAAGNSEKKELDKIQERLDSGYPFFRVEQGILKQVINIAVWDSHTKQYISYREYQDNNNKQPEKKPVRKTAATKKPATKKPAGKKETR